MRCQICGEEIENFYVFEIDGVERTVAYCDRCKSKVLSEALHLNRNGLALMVAHARIVQEGPLYRRLSPKGGPSEIFVKMPVVVMSVLFERDERSIDREIMEIYRRRIHLLQKQLERAVENEEYRKASKLKKEIMEIKRIMERK